MISPAKLGVGLSVLLLVIVAGIGTVTHRGIADFATSATRSELLVKAQLPSHLVPIFVSEQAAEDATVIYTKILTVYRDNLAELSQEQPPDVLLERLTDLVLQAMERGQVKQGFLDQYIPVEPGAQPRFRDALEVVPYLVLGHASQLFSEGQQERSVQAIRAVWALGQRAFEKNDRLSNRWHGLRIMADTCEQLDRLSGQTELVNAKHVQAWAQVLQAIVKKWGDKYKLIAKTKPHIGNLINIAQQDQDVTFRIAAILKLGVVKFNPGSTGNKRAIIDAIDQEINNPHPLIAQAAQAANALTLEQMRHLY